MNIREVTEKDLDLLFQWANDPDARKNAFHPEKKTYTDHCKWFAKKMASDNTYMFILMEDSCPIGQCRLDIEDREALISYFIVPSSRGKGYGKELLRLVKDKVKSSSMDIRCLTAQVKLDNIPSQCVFEALGYSKNVDEKNGFIEYKLEVEER